MWQPLVSIIIPVYNGSNYLREAIDSALAQTWPNIEVLVVNDGSDDGGMTEEIALSYKDKIRYIRKENGGVASALNTGIRNMRGEYFSWLSHDDLYFPNKIEKEIKAVVNSGDATRIVQCEYVFHDEKLGTDTPTDFHIFYTIEQLTNSVFSVLQLQIHACGALIHKDNFRRAGFFDESIRTVQDIDMWFRLLRGQKSLFVPEPLFTVREHGEAGSKTISSYYKETCDIYQRILGRMNNEELDQVFGSAWRFLIRMTGFVRSYSGDLDYLKKRIALCKPNTQDIYNLNRLKQKIGIGRDRFPLIYIFGAGQYGIRMHCEMQTREIAVAGFIDNSEIKRGQIVDELICQMPEDIIEKKDDAVILLAARNCSGMVEQLREMGFTRFLTRQEIDGILSENNEGIE